MLEAPHKSQMKGELVVLVGCGSMALEAAEYINSLNKVSKSKITISDILIDPDKNNRFNEMKLIFEGLPKISYKLEEIKEKNNKKFLIAIGDSEAKSKIFAEIKKHNFSFKTIIHPSAQVSKFAKIEEGSIICPYVFIGPFSTICTNTIINVGTIIGHDVKIMESSVISPHCDINGGSKIGKAVFIGAGSIIDPGIEVGNFSKISSGTIIKKNVDAGSFTFGNPTKSIKFFNKHNGEILFKKK